VKFNTETKVLLWFGFIMRIIIPLGCISLFILSIVGKLDFLIIFMVGIAIPVGIFGSYAVAVSQSIIIQHEGYKPEDFKFRYIC
jgi:hypothetical protein